MTLQLKGMELDDRREVYRALEYLNPLQRLDWLRWCCRLASSTGRHGEVFVTDGDGSIGQVFADLSLLELQYGLDFKAAAEELVRRARAA